MMDYYQIESTESDTICLECAGVHKKTSV